ncbi:alpha/beta fold hydrolase [Lutibaculum baratangense]|uniref:Lysophospholipase L2 n=1 Tax=Lutibaculum baratangense AMV1 TaxID=631454 RepID=V4RDL4_9HYPH|nr:alpha/beta hydrolase [Lutibaculum baratangense]ESR24256.1 Lysophospholipase L2 [Lutibaculum baratangense AMV1]
MTLVDIPENPVPPGAVSGEIVASDGVRLRYARWPKKDGVALRGTVSLFGGRAEFIEKYFEVVEDLRSRGFAVATLDWRGQGGSQRLTRNPRKGHVRRFSDYEKDLAVFMREVVLPDCPAPHYALAHSMGGAVLLRHARKSTNLFDRIVLSAPMVSLHERTMPGPFLSRLIAVLRYAGLARHYVPGGGDTAVNTQPFDTNPVTSDRARYDRTEAVLRAAPELGLGAPTIGWVHAALSTIRLFAGRRFPGQVHVPVLIVVAGAEAIVSNLAIERLALRLKTGGQVVVPGAMHELLMERDIYREQFWAAFEAFARPDDLDALLPPRETRRA